jgi:uncharacterized phage protein (TIGR01671 family)
MREIKFRAWHTLERYWIADFMTSLYLTGRSLDDLFNHIDHIKVMQFTGLLDKNGKEIYEGDVCVVPNGMMYSKVAQTMVPGKYRVYWNDDRWGLKAGNGDDYDNGDYYRGDDINNWNEAEIIGNIYENPELLED